MMKLQYFRGPRALYNAASHGNGIYFALDTKEIIHNGLSFVGNFPEDLKDISESLNEAKESLLILNGTGEGSIQNQIDLAINDFANKLTENGTIDTFKELLDYVTDNTSSDLLINIERLQQNDKKQDLLIESLQAAVEDSKQDLLLKISENTQAIENLSIDVDQRINEAFSWENVD